MDDEGDLISLEIRQRMTHKKASTLLGVGFFISKCYISETEKEL
jgi:hypothetical protein